MRTEVPAIALAALEHTARTANRQVPPAGEGRNSEGAGHPAVELHGQDLPVHRVVVTAVNAAAPWTAAEPIGNLVRARFVGAVVHHGEPGLPHVAGVARRCTDIGRPPGSRPCSATAPDGARSARKYSSEPKLAIATTPADQPMDDVNVVAALRQQHGRALGRVGPVAAHERMGLVPRVNALAGLDRNDLAQQTRIDDLLDLSVEMRRTADTKQTMTRRPRRRARRSMCSASSGRVAIGFSSRQWSPVSGHGRRCVEVPVVLSRHDEHVGQPAGRRAGRRRRRSRGTRPRPTSGGPSPPARQRDRPRPLRASGLDEGPPIAYRSGPVPRSRSRQGKVVGASCGPFRINRLIHGHDVLGRRDRLKVVARGAESNGRCGRCPGSRGLREPRRPPSRTAASAGYRSSHGR